MIHVPFRLTAAAGGAAALLLIGAGTGFAQSPQSVKTLTLTGRHAHYTTIDLGAPGPSAGDIHVVTASLYLKSHRIGTLRGTYTTVSISGKRQLVSGLDTFSLGHGDQIIVAISNVQHVPADGPIRNRRFEQAVIGGTGTYAGARGSMTLYRPGADRYTAKFRLIF